MNDSVKVNRVDAVLADPMAESREHGGGIGFVGPDIPIEVLLASGRPFGHLPWRVDDSTPWADRWLESSFPFWARSIVEQWHAGSFDALDSVVFSRGDDASQRLYYYIAELQRRGKLGGPSLWMFDIAYVERDSSFAHTAAAVTALIHTIDVSTDALPAAIDRANRLRRSLFAIEQSRTAQGPLYERLARAILWSDPTQWVEQFAAPSAAAAKCRVMLAGSMPLDERIHAAVEATDASIVAEGHSLSTLRLGPELDLNGKCAEDAIARHLRAHSIAPRAFVDRAARLVARVRDVAADAVILWLTREDEALAWFVPAQKRLLAEAGIPSLVLPASRWQADGDTLEEISAFCRENARATA